MTDTLADDVTALGDIKAIPTILNVICRSTGMRFAAVARVTEDRWIACSVRDDIAFGLKPGDELKVETTLCHDIRQSGQAIIIDHVAKDSVYSSHHTPHIYGLQSYISMPITLADGSVFGTLCAIDPEPHHLNNPETVAMFEMFAEIIGDHLSAIDRMHSVEANLLDERAAASLREQFIAVLGHDLRNPLAAISSGMRILLRRPLDDDAAGIVRLIQGSVGRMAGLIDDVMDFARSRLGGGFSLERGDDAPVEAALAQVAAEMQVSMPNRVIETDIQLTSPVNCDSRRIAQLTSNLLSNALIHGAPDQPVRLKARTRGRWFEISVSNAGDPIPATILESIFQPFARGAHLPNQAGLGLGLYIVQQIAAAHGGTIQVTSALTETSFSFRMPRNPGQPGVEADKVSSVPDP